MIVHTHNTHLQNVQTAIEIVHMYNMRCSFTLLTICTQHDGGSFTPREAPATWKCIGPGFSGCACRLWGRPARQATSASDGERVYLRLRKKKKKLSQNVSECPQQRANTYHTDCVSMLWLAPVCFIAPCDCVHVCISTCHCMLCSKTKTKK